jgi:hypothetical protein
MKSAPIVGVGRFVRERKQVLKRVIEIDQRLLSKRQGGKIKCSQSTALYQQILRKHVFYISTCLEAQPAYHATQI